MKWLAIVCILVLGGIIVRADEAVEKPTFTTLAQAVAHISQCLEKNTSKDLFAACTEKRKPSRLDETIFSHLQKRNEDKKLAELYSEREFPQDQKVYKLGGHGKELGHIHIDFMKRGKTWSILKIWMCR